MRWALAIAASLIALVSLLVYTVDSHNGGQPPVVPRGDTASFPDGRVARLEAELRELTTRIESLPSSTEGSPDSPAAFAEVDALHSQLIERFGAVETELQSLKKTLENLVPAADVIGDQFSEPTGRATADTYFEQGKFATAAGGYMTFLQNNPNHPDAVDILRKARDAYRRAGYGAMAMELQERILRDYQLDDRHRELMTLARYNKEVKRYDEAIRQLDAAAEAATSSKEKLVAHSYRSWYTELGQGAAAGLAAYRQAEQYAAELGMSEDIAATKIRKKIEQLQKIVAATQN